jgi:RNA polymerase sigma factor (sigma-70 family)
MNARPSLTTTGTLGIKGKGEMLDEGATGTPAGDQHERERRWQALAALREDAIRLVRARTMQREDAEEHVQEAMLRLVQIEVLDLDPVRLRALLVRAACCLSVDRYRRSVRQRRLLPRLFSGGDGSPEELAADRSEAHWLAAGLGELGSMEREALLHSAAGRRPGEIAALLGVDYKSAENALGRARRKLRLRAAGVTVGLAALARRLRGAEHPAMVTSSACAVLLLVHSGGSRPPAAVAPAPAPVQLVAPHVDLSNSQPVAARVMAEPAARAVVEAVATPAILPAAAPAPRAATPAAAPAAPVATPAPPPLPPPPPPVTMPPPPWKGSPGWCSCGGSKTIMVPAGTPQGWVLSCATSPTRGVTTGGDVCGTGGVV